MPMTTMDRVERILAIPTAEFERLGRFQGFRPNAERYLRELLRPEHARFLDRASAEEDVDFKQIIPYVVFQCGDRVFCYRRGQGQGEARLLGKRSIGVGGHVDEADADGSATLTAYEKALRRELEEEVVISAPGTLEPFGLINDDETPVGRVHLGIVHRYRLDSEAVSPRESGLSEAGFVPLTSLQATIEDLETWSRICVEALLGGEGLR